MNLSLQANLVNSTMDKSLLLVKLYVLNNFCYLCKNIDSFKLQFVFKFNDMPIQVLVVSITGTGGTDLVCS